MGRRDKGNKIDGWLVFDKPVGMTSTEAVSRVKRLFNASKAGHAGTLDPLASGSLPIALGEATKTVSLVMDGRKLYRFTINWGAETTTDDTRRAGRRDIRKAPERGRNPRDPAGVHRDHHAGPAEDSRPSRSPASAPTISPARARTSSLSRARSRSTGSISSTCPDRDHAEFLAECGKGAYVRALARDMGRRLGTHGHVVALRRLAVGPFARSTA